MKLDINILAKGKTLTIQDNTKYLGENEGFDSSRFRKSEVVALTMLVPHYSNESKNVVLHSYSDSITINFDGWVTVYYVVIPTKKWFENTKHPKLYGDITFYVDGENVYLDGEKVTDLSILTEINPIPTNISVIKKEYVSIQNLYDCYINYCQLLLQNRGFSKCWNKNTVDSELVYKRDLVWMAINVINYLVEKHKEDYPTLDEAQRIIELIHSCNGVCQEDGTINLTIKYGCGCSKR